MLPASRPITLHGCRLLTVDAYPESVAFYERFGFVANRAKPYQGRTHPSVQLGEERYGGIERFHHDADVVHPLDRHRRSAFPTVWNSRRAAREANNRSSIIEHLHQYPRSRSSPLGQPASPSTADRDRAGPLCANVRETPLPPKFSVEGEFGSTEAE